MADTYKIVRFYFNNSEKKIVKRGLTLEEAKAHCHSPESSSRTCTSPVGKTRTKRKGPWFDGFAEE